MKKNLKLKFKIRANLEPELAEIKKILFSKKVLSVKYEMISDVVERVGERAKEAKLNSMFDSRTKLLSASFGDELLRREVELSKRTGTFFSVALLDIDFLKYVNDNFGHIMGTKVIICVAKEIKRIIRRSDVACRYGGDEFLIIFPETDEEKAKEVIERIRRAIDCQEVAKEIKISFTSGVGQYNPESKMTAERFLDTVDKKLYHAKLSRVNLNLK